MGEHPRDRLLPHETLGITAQSTGAFESVCLFLALAR